MGFTDWYPVDLLSERLRCIGCSHEFHLPVKENSKQELQWRYRLNSLVNRAVDQDIIPAILAVHQIAKNNSISCINFGLELLKSNELIAEFDFLCVKNRQVVGGECKSGKKLTKKDYDLAVIASDVGFSSFFFCTPEDFDDNTKERIERLKSKISKSGSSTKIHVLTGEELFAEKPLDILKDI